MTIPTAAVAPLGAVPKTAPRRAPPCAFVIFGASGDLTRRKLVPALYNLAAAGLLPQPFATIGVARRPLGDEAFAEAMRAGVAEFSRTGIAAEVWSGFAPQLGYVAGDFTDPSTYTRLAERLDGLDRRLGLGGHRVFYLATPPQDFPVILESLKSCHLIHAPGEPSWSRVVIEKPFGRDLDSARQLNQLVARNLDESQTFRIDHYLGKETVQNILVFRFANSVFEPIWNRRYVDHVEIAAAETVGIGTRGAFYEKTGVLRDIVQNHLLEVLCLTAMEPPTTGGADDIRTEKLKVLRALSGMSEPRIEQDVVLGQYRGYREEKDVAPDSVTPTFAALRVHLENWRWQGVPFYLRAGKKLASRVTEVSLHMKSVPLSLFGRDPDPDGIPPNVITLRIQPDEGIQIRFSSKVPGHDLMIRPVLMDMSYREAFGGEPPEAYERLLLDVMRGDATLFSRRDAVEASWAWITTLLRHFEAHPPRGFPNYEPGSWGPEACDELMRRGDRAWRAL